MSHAAILESESSLVGLHGESLCPREPWPHPEPDPPEEPIVPPKDHLADFLRAKKQKVRYRPRCKIKRCKCGAPISDVSTHCNTCAKREQGVVYEPTPEEIKAECAAIRETWSELDWIHRCGRELEVGARVVKDPRLSH